MLQNVADAEFKKLVSNREIQKFKVIKFIIKMQKSGQCDLVVENFTWYNFYT